jgi:hypothetical protein
MGRGKPFQCEIIVSPGVREKLLGKHDIETWEIEEAVYDDPEAFSIRYRDCYFVYGQTFSGRYLLVLVRVLGPEAVQKLNFGIGTNVMKVITARDMNHQQRRLYLRRRGVK